MAFAFEIRGKIMRRIIMSLMLGFVLLGILSWQIKTTEADSRKIKVTAEGGYVVAWSDYDENSSSWFLGETIDEADPTVYNPVMFCWELPEDKRITGISGTKTLSDGSTEPYEDEFWYGDICCYGKTEDGKVIWGYDLYPHVHNNTKELLISPQIEDVDREPIILDMRNGISYYHNEFYGIDSFSYLKPLFFYCGDWCNIQGNTYSKEPKFVDLDKDGSWDIEVTSEGEFVDPYDGRWWDEQRGVIISLPTRNVTGDFCVTLNLDQEPISDINWRVGPWDCLFLQYGFHVPVIFRFGEEATNELHSIYVDEGYAEKYNSTTGDWDRITAAAPGDEIRICRKTFEGEYISAWKSNYWSKDSNSLTEKEAQSYCWLFMPGADVSFNAVKSSQIPYYLDFSQGYFCTTYYDDAIHEILKMVNAGSNSHDPENIAFDLNGDGTYDICVREWGEDPCNYDPQRVVVIPLSTNSIKGNFTLSATNDGSNWPLVLKFPENVNAEYSVTMKCGKVVDAGGNSVTHAAPGSTLYIESDIDRENEWYNYMSILKGYWDENSYLDFDGSVYFIMPAHDIEITPYRIDGDVIITPTPDPDEITPSPIPNENTPTPDEITPIPTVTPYEKGNASNSSEKDSEKPDEGGFNLLYILIPVCVALIAVAAVAYGISKKRNSK